MNGNSKPRPYPVAALGAITVTELARITRRSGAEAQKAITNGLTLTQADNAATALGLHVDILWPHTPESTP